MDYYVRTDKGERHGNEDYALCVRRTDGVWLFMVADGLGGHGKGDIASKFTLEYIKNLFVQANKIDTNFLNDSFYKAEKALVQKRKKTDGDKITMLTTVAALITDKKNFQFANTGDSRIYVFKNGNAYERSEDHSIPQMLYNEGKIKEDEIRYHPDRNKIVCAFGIPIEDFRIEISDLEPCGKDDAFLLCTDGLWEHVTEADMSEALQKSKTSSAWLDRMFEFVRQSKRSAPLDNFTGITVRDISGKE